MKKVQQQISETIIPSTLTHGSYYYIRNLSHNNLYLTFSKSFEFNLQQQQTQNQKPEINFCQISSSLQNSLQQVWMVQLKQNNKYKIVHAFSSMVLQNIGNQIKLRTQKQKNTQQFIVIQCQKQHKQFITQIKLKQNCKKQLFYDDQQLKCEQKHLFPKKNNKWVLQLITKHAKIDNSFILQFMLSNQVMQNLNNSQQLIIQNLLTKCFNQRFYIQKDENGKYFVIRSMSNGMVLDVEGQKKKQGVRIIQYGYKNTINQKWILEGHGKRLFIIRSAFDSQLMISVKGSFLKDQNELVLTKNQPDAFWIIYGNLLKLQNQ